MKHGKMKMLIAAALAAVMILGLAACGGSQTQPDSSDAPASEETQAPAETQVPAPETEAPDAQDATEAPAPDSGDHSAQETVLPFFQYNEIYGGTDRFDTVDAAVYDYLSFEKNRDYDPDHAMIPYAAVVAVDDADPSDVLIYGDYYLWEFALEGDVLVMVSGGHCPGVIHAEQSGEGETAVCSAVSMDEAFTDSDEARVFGNHYDAYRAIASDEQARDAAIAQVIADYARANGLNVTGYRLGGDETHQLP